MDNYNTSVQKIKPLNKYSERVQKAVEYLIGLGNCKFVILNNKGLPIKAYKNEAKPSVQEIIQGLTKTEHIGLVPKSLGLWVFVKTDSACKFKETNPIIYTDENGWKQFWYAGKCPKSRDPYRCNHDLSDPLKYCGRLIGKNEYIKLTCLDLINLASKLFNSGLFGDNGKLLNPETKSELSRYFVNISQKHINDRNRPYRNVQDDDMIRVIKSAQSFSVVPIIKALLLEYSARNSDNIKSGEIGQAELSVVLKEWLNYTKESAKISDEEQIKITEDVYNFITNLFDRKVRNSLNHHMTWIQMFKQGKSVTQIHRETGASLGAIRHALVSRGIYKPVPRKRRNN